MFGLCWYYGNTAATAHCYNLARSAKTILMRTRRGFFSCFCEVICNFSRVKIGYISFYNNNVFFFIISWFWLPEKEVAKNPLLCRFPEYTLKGKEDWSQTPWPCPSYVYYRIWASKSFEMSYLSFMLLQFQVILWQS